MQRVIGQVFRAQAALQVAAKLSVAFQEQLAQCVVLSNSDRSGRPGHEVGRAIGAWVGPRRP